MVRRSANRAPILRRLRQGGALPLLPAGAVLNLDAAAIATLGSGVELVPNAIPGHPVARFNGVDARAVVSNFAALFAGAGTLCIVHTVRDSDYTLASTSLNGHYDRFGGNGQAFPGVFHATDRYFNYGVPPIVGTHIKTYRASTTWQMDLDTVAGDIKPNHPFGFQNTALTIGRAPDGTGDVGSPFSGDIIQIIAYARHLTDADAYHLESHVIARYGLRSLVFDGDSLTQGAGASAGNDYPSQTLRLLDGRWHHHNSGVGGETVNTMILTAPTDVDPRYDARWGKNIVVFWGGTNSLQGGSLAEDTFAEIRSYCQARRAVGAQVVLLTILPRVGSPNFTVQQPRLNAMLRAGWSQFADRFFDVAAIAELQNPLDTRYYTDGVHLTDLGYSLVAAGVAPIITAV